MTMQLTVKTLKITSLKNSYAYGSLDVESVFSDQAINIRTTETFVF